MRVIFEKGFRRLVWEDGWASLKMEMYVVPDGLEGRWVEASTMAAASWTLLAPNIKEVAVYCEKALDRDELWAMAALDMENDR